MANDKDKDDREEFDIDSSGGAINMSTLSAEHSFRKALLLQSRKIARANRRVGFVDVHAEPHYERNLDVDRSHCD